MNWGGFTPFSLSDFPACVSAIAFTRGCNFNCGYCHNRHLLDPLGTLPYGESTAAISSSDILAFLDARKHRLDGLVISGGEPTCQPDLPAFVAAVKKRGIRVKLDTNGSAPEMLCQLLSDGLIDYVAMDIKAPFAIYTKVANVFVDTVAIAQSISTLRRFNTPYEFRVTVASQVLEEGDLVHICELADARETVYLQKCSPVPFANSQTMHTTNELLAVAKGLQQRFRNVFVR